MAAGPFFPPFGEGGDSLALEQIRGQARRYMVARYGESVWFRAPETFPNVVEQWIWGVASAEPEYAEARIAEIEQHLAAAAAEGIDITREGSD